MYVFLPISEIEALARLYANYHLVSGQYETAYANIKSYFEANPSVQTAVNKQRNNLLQCLSAFYNTSEELILKQEENIVGIHHYIAGDKAEVAIHLLTEALQLITGDIELLNLWLAIDAAITNHYIHKIEAATCL